MTTKVEWLNIRLYKAERKINYEKIIQTRTETKRKTKRFKNKENKGIRLNTFSKDFRKRFQKE